MNAKRCDRCGMYFEIDPDGEYLIDDLPDEFVDFASGDYLEICNYEKTPKLERTRIELCPDCAKDFRYFMKKPVQFDSGLNNELNILKASR